MEIGEGSKGNKVNRKKKIKTFVLRLTKQRPTHPRQYVAA